MVDVIIFFNRTFCDKNPDVPQNTSAKISKEHFVKLYQDLVCHVL